MGLQKLCKHRSQIVLSFFSMNEEVGFGKEGGLKKRAGNGWGARVRTWECEIQNLVTCHLSTPQFYSCYFSIKNP